MGDVEQTTFVVEYGGDRFPFGSIFAAAHYASELEKRGLVPVRVCMERGASRAYFKDGAATQAYEAVKRNAARRVR